MVTTHGSLFSGYDGLGLAIEQAFGARTVWVSDNNPAASKVLTHRLPGVPNLGDITRIDWAAVPPVTILSGGFPCQDVSHAGRRAGLIRGETRTGLWAHMLTAIDKLRPALVVAENVRGLLSARADSDVESCPWCVGDEPDGVLRALGAVLGDLADIGYDAEWVGLPASGVGACHGRFRVFIAAYPRGEVGEFWAGLRARVTAGLGWGRPGDDDSPAALNLLPTPRATDGTKGGPNQRGSSGDLMLPSAVALLPTPSASAFNDTEDLDAWSARRDRVRESAGNGNGFGVPLGVAVRLLPTPTTEPATGNGHARNLGAEARLLPTPSAADANSSGAPEGQTYRGVSLTDATVRQPGHWGQYADAIERHERIHGPAPSPTEPGRNGQPRLSPRFVEWMMCLAPGWVTDVPGISRNDQLKMLGNGVVPPQAVAALHHLARCS